MAALIEVDAQSTALMLQAVLNSSYPRMALPTIASNHNLTLDQLQTLLGHHGYPDKQRMRASLRRILTGIDDPETAAAPAPVERREPYVTALAVSDLFADDTYQRELDVARVQRMVSHYDPALVGILEVSRRDDGRHALLDGQHRWAMIKDVAFDTEDVPHVACRVHTGLTIADEAKLYHQLNTTRRSLTGWDRWLARRAAGDQAVVDIEACIVRNGFRTGMQAAPGVLRATKACENVVSLAGIPLLDEVLDTIRNTWGDDQSGLDAAIIHGLGQVLHAYTRDELNLGRLITELQGIVPRQLTARADAVRELHKGTRDRLTAHIIVDRYNSSKGPKLQAFFDRVKPATKVKLDAAARENAAVREWAERQGLITPGKPGRLGSKVRAAYAAAHPTEGAA